MEILVTYNAATDTAKGRRRLRRVARVCEAFGQRVQKSVSECIVSPAEMERLKGRLSEVIDESEDSLRLYRLRARDKYLQTMGRPLAYDLHDPLVI